MMLYIALSYLMISYGSQIKHSQSLISAKYELFWGIISHIQESYIPDDFHFDWINTCLQIK